MEPKKALELLNNVGASFVGNLVDHQNIQTALAVITRLIADNNELHSQTETSSIPVKVDPALYSPAAGYRLSKKDRKAKAKAEKK